VSVWHHIQDILYCYAFLNTYALLLYQANSLLLPVQAIVSVEVTMVMCLLSCKRFGKILLYTDLALDIADGDNSDMESSLRVARNV
jgi:hypothetical protein